MPYILKFSDPHLFADDIKNISVNNSNVRVQLDLTSIDAWVSKNRMRLPVDRRFRTFFCGIENELSLPFVALEKSDFIKKLRML